MNDDDDNNSSSNTCGRTIILRIMSGQAPHPSSARCGRFVHDPCIGHRDLIWTAPDPTHIHAHTRSQQCRSHEVVAVPRLLLRIGWPCCALCLGGIFGLLPFPAFPTRQPLINPSSTLVDPRRPSSIPSPPFTVLHHAPSLFITLHHPSPPSLTIPAALHPPAHAACLCWLPQTIPPLVCTSPRGRASWSRLSVCGGTACSNP
jgi:hypothetical protein